MALFRNNTFISGGRNPETATYSCRFCNFKVRFKLNLFFNIAAHPLGHLILFLHATIFHWSVFTLNENFFHIRRILILLPMFFLFAVFDFFFGTLWLLTFPFWWVHNQLL